MSRLHREAAQRMRAYFEPLVECYGRDPRSVDWQSTEAQHARFAAVVPHNGPPGATLLDAGCGIGHLYGYLKDRRIDVTYTGCDVTPALVAAARGAYPEARFVAADLLEVLAVERFDYVVACGLLHVRVPRWNRWAWDLISAMYAGSRRGLSFTLPVRGFGHAPVLHAVDPSDWLARLRVLNPHTEVHLLPEWGDAVYVMKRSPDAGTVAERVTEPGHAKQRP